MADAGHDNVNAAAALFAQALQLTLPQAVGIARVRGGPADVAILAAVDGFKGRVEKMGEALARGIDKDTPPSLPSTNKKTAARTSHLAMQVS